MARCRGSASSATRGNREGAGRRRCGRRRPRFWALSWLLLWKAFVLVPMTFVYASRSCAESFSVSLCHSAPKAISAAIRKASRFPGGGACDAAEHHDVADHALHGAHGVRDPSTGVLGLGHAADGDERLRRTPGTAVGSEDLPGPGEIQRPRADEALCNGELLLDRLD